MTAQECLKKGEYCDELAQLTLNNQDRVSLQNLADEWRSLAAHDSYYALCLTAEIG